MSKTVKYILAIAILLSLNLLLLFKDSLTASKTSKKAYFDGYDFSELATITFQREQDSFSMAKVGDSWKIDQESVDQGFFNTLISVLERVETNRQLEWKSEPAGNIIFEFGGGKIFETSFATNATKTKSYLIQDGRASEVSVPGYRDNVVDIFMLHPDQWKDRLVLDGSWRTIQRLTVNRAGRQELEIVFDDKFFLVNDQPAADSSAVVDFLNQFQYYQANEIISSGRFPELDSLKEEAPMASIEIDDIKMEQPITLFIYPKLPNQPYHLVVTNEGRMMVFDQRRIQDLFRLGKDFGVYQ